MDIGNNHVTLFLHLWKALINDTRNFEILLYKLRYYVVSVCLGSIVVSVMDSHSCDRGSSSGQGNHIS